MSSFRVKPTKCSPDPLGLIKSRRCRCRLIWLDHCDGEKRRKPHQYFSPTHKFIYTSESHFVFIREVSCVSILIEMSICLIWNMYPFGELLRVCVHVWLCVVSFRTNSIQFHPCEINYIPADCDRVCPLSAGILFVLCLSFCFIPLIFIAYPARFSNWSCASAALVAPIPPSSTNLYFGLMLWIIWKASIRSFVHMHLDGHQISDWHCVCLWDKVSRQYGN